MGFRQFSLARQLDRLYRRIKQRRRDWVHAHRTEPPTTLQYVVLHVEEAVFIQPDGSTITSDDPEYGVMMRRVSGRDG